MAYINDTNPFGPFQQKTDEFVKEKITKGEWDKFSSNYFCNCNTIGKKDLIHSALGRALFTVGCLDTLKKMKKNGWDFTHPVYFLYAARVGNVPILEWLKEEGCEWNEGVCFEAVVGGSVESLFWLRSQNPPCPFTDNIRSIAQKKWPFIDWK